MYHNQSHSSDYNKRFHSVLIDLGTTTQSSITVFFPHEDFNVCAPEKTQK